MKHDPERQRFVLSLPGGDAYVEYARPAPGVLDLQHTVVPKSDRGHGIGSQLVEQVLDYVREQNLRVIPSCPFVRAWLEEHRGYRDLVQ